ncbi:ATP-binding protein [Streptomyces sp. SID5910]|uniref:ATP-binding protein n=1 Tax=Streptomyces sp. SID5910 TaxID=2690312 RepID=UPI001F3FAA85|nr:ATP-binding protein [Streptomyces sp. SID5910]
MTVPGPVSTPVRRLPPRPQSAAEARRFVREVLDGVSPDAADTAQLLVSELVTNAVVHAHTDVEVRAWAADGRVHVHVSDDEPNRVLVPHRGGTAYSGTGRGLAMVEELASNHGVLVGEDQKTVWFELWPDTPEPPASGWSVPDRPATATATVELVDSPGALQEAAQQHRGALLRECLLAAFADDLSEAPPADLLTAHDANHLIDAALASASEESSHGDLYTMRLKVPADARDAVLTLGRVLETAQETARQGKLLTRPALPQIRAATRWLLGQVTGQLAGQAPTAWTQVAREPSTTPPELAPWDPSRLQAGSTPAIAADDGNRIIAVNAAAARLLGWPAQDLIGRRIITIIPEHLRERHVAAFTSLLLTGHPRILGRPVTMPALHRDGGLVEITLCIQTQEATDGRSVFVARFTGPERVADGS